ncbi:orotidine 5''-phosphate decarboxylase, subfamily 1 [Thermanaerovibrio velox DSM 12556]|uniref:Orotidine 5'-phosphate decarboxylase n=1 Tax=Thermanaerovibrio velox DSM 12556 TaxID=926567 RepID=H0US18_9BACT|nr:orotidine-5'-phosphate decarboxylase [Thermanaerovibrio velox]EHM10107.1 orotidine 5''-phosphate decarboxylase, subfamily 1 [Thermanaerovibrio velox DSM 12556]
MAALKARDRLILALDVNSLEEAIGVLNVVGDSVHRVKIGPRLFALGGLAFVQEVIQRGYQVFLDLKLHDIPNTVASAVDVFASTGLWALTVHAAGGEEMMKRASETRGGVNILAVTVLTSLGEDQWDRVCPGCSMDEALSHRAGLAQQSGVQGVVCSPRDLKLVKQKAPNLFTVVPGIRMPGENRHDQARVMGPSQAIKEGADFLVIGRPILEAQDKRSRVEHIVETMEVY